jgi:hypothetical protein
MKALMTWLALKLEDWCQRTGRYIHITGKQGPDDVYLIRYMPFKSKFLSVYVHRFLRSDIDDPHDHPFDFISYVVSGGYTEELFKNHGHPWSWPTGTDVLEQIDGARGPGSLGFRKAETIHKVLVDQPRTLAEKADAPLTIIVRGPYRREWQFWRTQNRFLSFKSGRPCFWAVPQVWNEYLGVEKHSRE